MPFERPQAGTASGAGSCAACGAALALPVRFCPFCGTAQAVAHAADAPLEPPAAPDISEPAAPLVFHLDPGPAAAPPPRPAPDPDPPPAPSPLPRVATPPAAPKRKRIGRNRAALVLVALAALGAGVLAERAAQAPAQRPPAPRASVEAGPAWAPVPLDRFRSREAVTLSAEAPFVLRLDGERVQRVQRSLRLPLRGLRRLEVRAARGSVRVAISGEAP